MTLLPSFEYCAFRFLGQWQRSEEKLHNAIKSSPTETDIRKALNYLQVARTFAGIDEAGKAASILKSFIEIRDDKNLPTPNDKVTGLASNFAKEFQQVNVSAASKLLWLSFREPYIVYDNRAYTALTRDFSHGFDQGDYAAFSKAWRREYKTHETSIESAVEQLPAGRIFMRACSLSDTDLVRMAKEAWFMERVFDIFLWEIGGVA